MLPSDVLAVLLRAFSKSLKPFLTSLVTLLLTNLFKFLNPSVKVNLLNDVNMACNLNIDTGDFLSFADYFFDGFVVDWVVQDRINNAKRQVEEAIRRTESIVNQLQRM